MNRKIVWSSIIFIIAFSLPILVGLMVTGNGNLLCGFIALFATFFSFWISYESQSNDLDADAMFKTSLVILFFGLVLTLIFAVTRNPNTGWITIIMWFVSMMVYRIA